MSRSPRRPALALCLIALAALVLFLARRPSRPSGPTTSAAAPSHANQPAAAAAASATAAAPAAPEKTPAAQAATAGEITNFRAALDEARGFRDPMLHAREFGRILTLWLARDFDAALAYVRQLPREGPDFTEGLLLTLDALAARDAEGALKLAGELVSDREQTAFYSSLFARLAHDNPAGAVAQLALVPPGVGREPALRAVADAWARADLPAALAWAQKLPDATERNAAFETALSELAAKDPLQAIELAQKSLSGPALERTIFGALQKLTATDPQGASTLVTLLPAGEMQLLAAVDVARAFAAQNVEAALAWTKTLPGGKTQTLALNNVLAIWARSDATAAGNYISALPAGPQQQTLAGEIAGTLTQANLKNAIDWAQALPADTRALALSRVADAWATWDPAAASHWVAEQSAGAVAFQVQTLGYTLSYWILKDAAAVQDFVRTLPAELQAGVATSAAPILAQQDPANALTWAQSLPVAAARDAATAAAFARWLDNAPDAARAWLATANLPAETKARLTKSP